MRLSHPSHTDSRRQPSSSRQISSACGTRLLMYVFLGMNDMTCVLTRRAACTSAQRFSQCALIPVLLGIPLSSFAQFTLKYTPAAQVANLSFDNYEKLWKMFVDAFEASLLACDGRWEPETAAATRLKQLCIEAGALRVAVALAHPSRMTHYHFMMGQARFLACPTRNWQGCLLLRAGWSRAT